jgi:amino-acid N-acetyltransferase
MTDQDGFLEWFRNAAPYFNAHRGRVIVVHVSGELLASDALSDLIHDLALLHSLGVRLVLVPGLRPQIEQRLAALGMKNAYEDGLRVTDALTMPVVREAAAHVSTQLQAGLSMGLANSPMHGARIRVTCGNFITARPIGIVDGLDHGYTGTVRRIDTAAIDHALQRESVVVIPPLGFSPTGETFNLHAENVATQVAVELRTHKLLFMDTAATLLDDQGVRIDNMSLSGASQLHIKLRTDDTTNSDVLRRFEAALHACRNGVPRVHLLDSSMRGALPLELFTRDGVGTMINADGYQDVRRATIEDVGGILELIEPLERDDILVRRSRREIESGIANYFVEQRDGAIIACAAAHPFADQQIMELACLAVRADYRDDGRADRLLRAVQAEARQLGATRLFVLTTQTTHWFRERGFVETELSNLPVERQALVNLQRRSKVLIKALS